MTFNDRYIEIQSSKLAHVLTIIGSLIFVGLGLWFVMYPPSPDNFIINSPTIFLFVCYASIFFFGIGAIIYIRKMSDNRPGLIINEEGITGNVSGNFCGKVLWPNITNISLMDVRNQRLILIEINNPYDYINSETNKYDKEFCEMNYNRFGTPISLTSNGLKISFNDLYNLLLDQFKMYRQ